MGLDQYLMERVAGMQPERDQLAVQWRKFDALNKWMTTFHQEQRRFDLCYQLRRCIGTLEERLFGGLIAHGWRRQLQRAMVFQDYPCVAVTARELDRLAELTRLASHDPASVGRSGNGDDVTFAAFIDQAREAIAAGKQLHYYADW